MPDPKIPACIPRKELTQILEKTGKYDPHYDTLDAIFEPTSVLIFNPENREMSTLERNLIDVLIGLPKLMGTKELIENLRLIMEQLDEVILGE